MLAAGSAAVCASAPDVAAPLRDALRTLAAEHHGLVGFHRHYLLDQRAPGHNAHSESDSGRLRDDGRLVWAHVYSRNLDGKVASTADLAKINAQFDQKPPGEDFDLPLSPDALAGYRLDAAACSGCASGLIAVSFASLKRDSGRWDGTFILDERSHRLVSIECKPTVLPKQADSGTMTVKFGRVLPDLWSVVEIHQRWTGHVLIIHGSRDITVTQSNFRRFSSIAQAHQAVQAGI